MPNQDASAEFDRLGYCIVRGALSPAEVTEIRRGLDEYWQATRLRRPDDYSAKAILPHEFYRLDFLHRLPLRKKIVEGLRGVLGKDFVFLPDFEVHRNHFSYPGWHYDAGSEGFQDYFFDPDYKFVKCGLFLQENNEEWGGAIDLIPSSHVNPLGFLPSKYRFYAKKLRDRLAVQTGYKTIRADVKPGDFVFFHSLLWHAGTARAKFKDALAEGKVPELPRERTKYVLYWDASATRRHAELFLQNAQARAEGEWARRDRKEAFFLDYVRFSFPDRFPPAFVSSVRDFDCDLLTLPPEVSGRWEEKYQSLSGPA